LELGVSVAGKLRELHMRRRGDHRRPLPEDFVRPLRGGRGLEVGGPSAVFGAEGLFPVYPLLGGVDCVQWAARTQWHDLGDARDFAPDGTRTGALHILDDIDLAVLPDHSYDVVLSAHVIEHIANPLRALAAWQRVTRHDGYLLLVVPHMAGTFDHRRSLTTIEHLVEDFERDTAEGDLTHLEETVALHDRGRDVAHDPEQWTADRRGNATTRVLHHHTFTTLSVGELLQRAGIEVLAIEARLPHEIYVLGRWRDEDGSDGTDLVTQAAVRSPFRVDRRAARRVRSRTGPSRSPPLLTWHLDAV
jgi:SAM-dependent methyltransferase